MAGPLVCPAANSIRFSTALPSCREGRLHPIGSVGPDWLIEVSEKADSLGYHSLWTNEFLTTDPEVSARLDDAPTYYDPLLKFAWVARATRDVRFMTSTMVLRSTSRCCSIARSRRSTR